MVLSVTALNAMFKSQRIAWLSEVKMSKMLNKLSGAGCWFVSDLHDGSGEQHACGSTDWSGGYADAVYEARGLIVKDPLEAMVTHTKIMMPSVLVALNA